MHAERGGPAQPDVELEPRVAERSGERRQLGQALHPVLGPAEHLERAVAGLEELDAVPSGAAADGSATSTTRRTSSGAFASSAIRLASSENRTHTSASPAAFACCASSGRLAGEGSPRSSRSTIAAWIARRRGADRPADANSRT